MAIQSAKKGIITERYRVFLDLMDAFHNLKLSDQEKNIVNAFFWQGGKINTETRKQVAELLKISAYNLNNQIGKLRGKKIISSAKDSPAEESIIVSLLPDVEADKRSLFITFEIIA